MSLSKSKSGARLDGVFITGILIVVCLLVVVFGLIWLVWTNSAPPPGFPSTSTGEYSAKKVETQELREASADGDARGASWISFERILLLAVVVANYLLLAIVAWSYWRRGRLNIGVDLSQRLRAIGAQLEAIERALRDRLPQPTTPPAPAAADPSPRTKVDEMPTEKRAPRSASEPVQRTQVSQGPPSQLAHTGPVDESRYSSESNAWKLVHNYCLVRGSSIVELGQRAKAQGLQIGSPSYTRGRRHILDSPDQDPRLLAIKDSREEKLFVVVGADATVSESDWLDLFTVRTFPGVSLVRSKWPATVNAVSGEVEEKGELEVLGST